MFMAISANRVYFITFYLSVLATLTSRLALLMGPPGRHCVAAKRGISRNGTSQCLGIVLHGDT